MDDLDKLIVLSEVGLRSEGIGPMLEWSPVPADLFQRRHDRFWALVSDLLPDDEEDEPFWMSEDAATQLMDPDRK